MFNRFISAPEARAKANLAKAQNLEYMVEKIAGLIEVACESGRSFVNLCFGHLNPLHRPTADQLHEIIGELECKGYRVKLFPERLEISW